MTLHKTYEISSFKALPDEGDEKGRFEAIVSVFNNVDLQGDRVMPGAFEKSIAAWRKSGDPIPIIWSHEWGDPFAHIGYANPNDVEEMTGGKAGTPDGLLVKGHLDVHKPFASQVYDLMKDRRVKEFSFAYDVVHESMGDDKANELHELSIIEAGPTLKGANPDTVSLGVKSQLEKAAKIETNAATLATALELDPEIAKALMDKNPDEVVEEKVVEADGEKAGRVIGSKAAAALKSRLSDAVDAFIDEVNGTGGDGEEDDGESDGEKTADEVVIEPDEIAQFKAQLDELG